MTQQHPITPPPELVKQWWTEFDITDPELDFLHFIATKAARWGADQGKIRSAPESPLVERVADAIAAQATSAGIVNDRPARAAIRTVALWLNETPFDLYPGDRGIVVNALYDQANQ